MEIDKKLLFELYVNKDMGLTKISRHLGVSIRTVSKLLKQFEIPARPYHQKGRGNRKGAILSEETKLKISKAHMGMKMSESAKEKLRARGKGWYMNNGYIFIRKPEHPIAFKHKGYVKRATIVLEEKIGRYLEVNELAHHINNIRDDDRAENLLLITTNEHNSLTASERWKSGELRMVHSLRKEF